jgi:thiol-disulfide isomerase/thioredoxin
VKGATVSTHDKAWRSHKTLSDSAGFFKVELKRPGAQTIYLQASGCRPLEIPLLVTNDDKDIKVRIQLAPASSPIHLSSSSVLFDTLHGYLTAMGAVAREKDAFLGKVDKDYELYVSKGGKAADFLADPEPLIRKLFAVIDDTLQHLFTRQYAAIAAMYPTFYGRALDLDNDFYEKLDELLPIEAAAWAIDPRSVNSFIGRAGKKIFNKHSLSNIALSPTETQGKPRSDQDATILAIWAESKSRARLFVQRSPFREVRAEAMRYLALNAKSRNDQDFPRFYEELKAYSDFANVANALKRINPESPVRVGAPVPEFKFKLLDSSLVLSPTSLRGRFFIIDFWATWCGPCISAIEDLEKIYPKYSRLGVEFLSVSFDADSLDVRKFRQSHFKMPWLHAWNPAGFDGEIAKRFLVTGIPKLLIISPEGVIVAVDVSTGQPLERKLEELLAQHGGNAPR